jgi:hypothetical protein
VNDRLVGERRTLADERFENLIYRLVGVYDGRPIAPIQTNDGQAALVVHIDE